MLHIGFLDFSPAPCPVTNSACSSALCCSEGHIREDTCVLLVSHQQRDSGIASSELGQRQVPTACFSPGQTSQGLKEDQEHSLIVGRPGSQLAWGQGPQVTTVC